MLKLDIKSNKKEEKNEDINDKKDKDIIKINTSSKNSNKKVVEIKTTIHSNSNKKVIIVKPSSNTNININNSTSNTVTGNINTNNQVNNQAFVKKLPTKK